MDLVTFLILTYNSEKWIEECINSVLNQTYINLQVLIIDDGSSDSTVARIHQIFDNRIELFCKEHSGISKSLNFAMSKIKADFVARIDSDDLCDKERIIKQMKFMNENPEYGIIGSNFILVDEKGKQIDKIRNPRSNDDIVDQLPRRCCVWNGSLLMRNIILKKLNRFNENLIAGEDWDFFLRAIGLTKFYNIQEFLSTKRIHSASISETDIAKQTTKKILLNYNNTIIKNSEVKTEIAKSYFNIGYYYYYESDFINAYKYFREALHKGGMNFQFIRYSFSAKYLKSCINFYRKYRLYKLFDWIRYFDNANKFMRNKF